MVGHNERGPAQSKGTRRLAEFSNAGYSNGRHLPWMAAWIAVTNLVFERWWFPRSLRPMVLRFFGAEVGQGCLIRQGVRVHWPWRLRLGDHVWLGEGVWLHTIEDIEVEDNVCVSQFARIVTGSHDYTDPHFRTDNAPILLRSGCWVGAGALVMRGVTVGVNSVIGGGAVVYRDVPDDTLVLPPESRTRSIAVPLVSADPPIAI
jgi:putative colanic acid biosynthesis acetyltransferase WcaF